MNWVWLIKNGLKNTKKPWLRLKSKKFSKLQPYEGPPINNVRMVKVEAVCFTVISTTVHLITIIWPGALIMVEQTARMMGITLRQNSWGMPNFEFITPNSDWYRYGHQINLRSLCLFSKPWSSISSPSHNEETVYTKEGYEALDFQPLCFINIISIRNADPMKINALIAIIVNIHHKFKIIPSWFHAFSLG